MLFYVPYHVSGCVCVCEGKRMYLQSFLLMFLTNLGIMTGSCLISKKLTAPG